MDISLEEAVELSASMGYALTKHDRAALADSREGQELERVLANGGD
jgi:hypothetical protein